MDRYSRNIRVIGEEGQRRLSSSSVFVVGCGALGGQLAMLLAGAGIGRIGIADFDTIDLSNLQRQLFFSEDQCGQKKCEVIAEKIRSLNSEIELKVIDGMISSSNADSIFPGYDIIADATDNPATKYFIDNTCRTLGKGCSIGGVAGWRGQVLTFKGKKDRTAYSEVFPIPLQDISMLPCEIEGVLGSSASTVASIQASEIIRLIISDESSWKDTMVSIDLSLPVFHTIPIG